MSSGFCATRLLRQPEVFALRADSDMKNTNITSVMQGMDRRPTLSCCDLAIHSVCQYKIAGLAAPIA
jgi:hypothetical protein